MKSIVQRVYNRLLRPVLPWKIGVCNGVAVRRHKLFDRHIISQDYEQTAVSAIQSLVRSGDHVVIIGGGEGVTAVWAAFRCGESGHVDVYEAVEETADRVRDTVALAGVEPIVSIHVEAVSANTRLPECDVLEIDCEGCEVEVLPTLTIDPRATIVEHHVTIEAK